jgi:suppressor of G2 allele of SKP1
VLHPLKGQINPDTSEFTVGKIKVEIRLVKCAPGRWGDLVGDSPDRKCLHHCDQLHLIYLTALAAPMNSSSPPPDLLNTTNKQRKNWEGITTSILSSEKEKTTEEDPNVGGDTSINTFFQKIFGDADEDTKRAMMKSYSESGGTTLSTNWEEVKKAPVEVKPPAGSEWKKWGA